MREALHFSPPQQDEFIKTLRRRVNLYLKGKKSHAYANVTMKWRSALLLSVWIGLYTLLIGGGLSPIWNYLLWSALGIAVALVTTNIGHDAIHGAYSKKKWVNHLLGHTFNFNGASAYMWTKMHNTAHHTYTNVDGYDEDINFYPMLRISPHGPRLAVHRFQHLYAVFFYCMATLFWVFFKDYKKFFQNEVGNISGKKHPKKEYFYLFFYKSIYYTLYLALPLLLIAQPWWQILLGFLLMHCCEGLYLTAIFMLAHVVEATHFPLPTSGQKVEDSWATHQLHTTANFAAKNPWTHFFTGGLNMQVEHHLFPNVCSIHYPAIGHLVRKTAKEFGLPYKEYPSFAAAVHSHLRFLRAVGRGAQIQPHQSINLRSAA